MYGSLVNDLIEATFSDLTRKQRSITRLFPTFHDRVRAIGSMGGLRLRNVDKDNWYFRVHSGTKNDVWYEVIVHFKNIVPRIQELVADRRLWVSDRSRVDLRKLADRFLKKVHIQLYCSCPAFQYWGPAYILSLSKYDAKYSDPETRPPRKRNPRQYGAYCKHTAAMMKTLPFYTTTVAKWLKDFYSGEIKAAEERTKRKYGWYKAAAAALAKSRKAGKQTKRRVPAYTRQ